MQTSGFEEFVRTTRFTMSIIGIWPATNYDKHWYQRYQFLVPVFFMIFFVNVPQTRMLVFVWGDLNAVLEILTMADILVGLACIKLLGIWYNKQNLRYLLLKMEQNWKSIGKDHEFAMWENVKICKIIVSFYTMLAYLTMIVYTVSMIIVVQSHAAQVEDMNITANKPLFVNSKFFFDTEHSPIFEIVWICQFISFGLGIGAFISFDGFFIFSILHLCGQLINLQLDLSRTVLHSRRVKNNFAQLLKPIIEKHFYLSQFTNSIEDNFNKVFLIQMICYSVTLCLQGYQIVVILTENSEIKLASLVFIVPFTLANLLSLFMYCFIAEKLRTESSNIFFIAYETNWYELKPKDSIMLLNVMHASKSPFQITAGKFAVFSFEYFMTILKTSGGYLSMLLAIKNRIAN